MRRWWAAVGYAVGAGVGAAIGAAWFDLPLTPAVAIAAAVAVATFVVDHRRTVRDERRFATAARVAAEPSPRGIGLPQDPAAIAAGSPAIAPEATADR